MSNPEPLEQALEEKEQELIRLREQLKVIQAQLIQSEKMAGLGSLAAGLAHELNNPIGFVKNNAISLREYMKILVPLMQEILACAGREEKGLALQKRIDAIAGGNDLAFMLEDIDPLLADSIDGTIQVEEIVGGLQRFARTDDPKGEPFDLNQCVRDTLQVVWNKLKYKADVHQRLGELVPLHGKPGEINQVIMNLLVNAAQAIPEFGKITIETARSGSEILLRIANNGQGIPEKHLDKLLTPSYSTKAEGKSTGLGLSISHGIVTGHGGRIKVQSKPGKGTVFSLYLPIPDE